MSSSSWRDHRLFIESEAHKRAHIGACVHGTHVCCSSRSLTPFSIQVLNRLTRPHRTGSRSDGVGDIYHPCVSAMSCTRLPRTHIVVERRLNPTLLASIDAPTRPLHTRRCMTHPASMTSPPFCLARLHDHFLDFVQCHPALPALLAWVWS